MYLESVQRKAISTVQSLFISKFCQLHQSYLQDFALLADSSIQDIINHRWLIEQKNLDIICRDDIHEYNKQIVSRTTLWHNQKYMEWLNSPTILQI